MKSATASAPLQRTMSGGNSLATLKANTAGCRAQAWTACRTASRAAARVALRVQKAKVLVPWNVNEQQQIVLRGEVEEPARRHMINAEQVRARLAHERKIARRLLRRGERFALRVGRERPVREAFDAEFFCAAPEEFAVHDSHVDGRHLIRP